MNTQHAGTDPAQLRRVNATPRAICAIDVDNFLAERDGYSRFYIADVCDHIRAVCGSNTIIRAFCNRMARSIERRWMLEGADVSIIGQNVDPFVSGWLNAFSNADIVGIWGGDHYYVETAVRHARLGHKIIVAARKERASRALLAVADRYIFINPLVDRLGSQMIH